MNLPLLHKNFTQHYPDEYDGFLDSPGATILSVEFNRRGTLLAGGCNDGKILIWDFVTRNLLKVIIAHSHPVSSINWSRDGRYLVSAGCDNYVHIWEVLTGKCIFSFRSTIPILYVVFCPRVYKDRRIVNYEVKTDDLVDKPTNDDDNDNQTKNAKFPDINNNPKTILPHLLVLPMQSCPRILDLHNIVKNQNILTNKYIFTIDNCVEDNDHNFVVSWNRRGDKLYVGNGKGKVFVYEWYERSAEEISSDVSETNKSEKSASTKNKTRASRSSTRKSTISSRNRTTSSVSSNSSESALTNTPKITNNKAATWEFRLAHYFKITQPAAIRLIVFSKKTNKFLITTDRIIRLYQEEMLTETYSYKHNSEGSSSNHNSNHLQKSNKKINFSEAKDLVPYNHIKDQISRQLWKVCCFSGDGEYICAAQVKQSSLSFYETDLRSENLLVKKLSTKGNDTFTDIAWHPCRPIILACINGDVTIYTHNYFENWSAFAPDFEELEENRLYMEKENEFDDYDSDASEPESQLDVEGEIVEIEKMDRIAAYCSSDEEELDKNFLEYIPLNIDDIERGHRSILSGFISGFGGSDAKSAEVLNEIEELKKRKFVVLNPSLGVAGKRTASQRKMTQEILSNQQVSANNNDSDNDDNHMGDDEITDETEDRKYLKLNLGNQELVHPLIMAMNKKVSRGGKRRVDDVNNFKIKRAK